MLDNTKDLSHGKSVNYPVSNYARIAAGTVFRYQGDSVLNTSLVTPDSLFKDYSVPLISPQIRTAMNSLMSPEEPKVGIDASSLGNTSHDFKIIIDKKTSRPKTARSRYPINKK